MSYGYVNDHIHQLGSNEIVGHQVQGDEGEHHPTYHMPLSSCHCGYLHTKTVVRQV